MNLIQTLVSGGNGYCRHDSLRRYNDRTRSLISRIEAFGRSLRPEAFSARDVVHWDLHPGNLLVEGGAISAIVDTDFVIVGDATFDLVMLALTSLGVHCERGVTTRLLSEAVGHLDELRAQAYLGHLFVRLIDWPIRRRNASEVDFWLDRSDEHLTI